ncbi:MAG: hypothetical protein K2X77_33435 [Candidatus Obscuribacterales bacterium]|nr:hypothetical protein [Candidatus Obscuribacterales bacterium]
MDPMMLLTNLMNLTTMEAILLGVASVIVLLGLLYAARHYYIQKHRQRYRDCHGALRNLLQCTENTIARLQADAHLLVNGDETRFANVSAEQHKAARQTWSDFLDVYRSACERKSQAEDAFKLISSRPVALQHYRNLKKAIALLTAPVSRSGESLVASSIAAAAALQRFEDAFAANSQKLSDLKRERDSLGVSFSEANKLDLQHPSYRANFDKINRLIDALEAGFTLDPLEGHAKAIRYLESKQRELNRILTGALRLHALVSCEMNRASRLHERIDALKRTPLTSSLQELPAFTSGHSFDEPGYVLQDSLDELARMLVYVQGALKGRRNLSFKQGLESYTAQLAQTENLIDTVLADKDAVDSAINFVYTENSTDNDIAADSEARASIAALYKAQRFHEARLAAERLRQEHEIRCRSREQIGQVALPLEMVVQCLHNNKEVISRALDRKFQLLVSELSELGSQAQEGKADWPALVAQAEALIERLAGGSIDSIYVRANSEIAKHDAAKETVAVLQEQFAFLDKHLAWAGLAEATSAPMAEASSVLASAAIGKQDWDALRERAESANAGLLEVRALLDPILAEHEVHRLSLATFQNQLEACAWPKAYAREICGKTFGASLSCQINEASAQLPGLTGNLERRNYAALAAGLGEAWSILKRENLLTWWSCLQLMANSGTPCAMSFALKAGYSVGEFDAWLQEKLDLSGAELYQPAKFQDCCKQKSGSFNVARHHADPPPASDYKAGKPATTDNPMG